ncbi:MAG: DinB family protein [Bacteroidota bacterium]
MNEKIEKIRKTRKFLLAGIGDLTIEQLNKVPAGFNNNIIWNTGHLVAAQQGLCYTRASLSTVVDENFMLSYKSGSKPERFIDAHEFEIIKQYLFSTLDQLESHLDKKIFGGYTPWTTRYGVEIKSIDNAVDFLSFHEGLHLGTINSLKRLVQAK